LKEQARQKMSSFFAAVFKNNEVIFDKTFGFLKAILSKKPLHCFLCARSAKQCQVFLTSFAFYQNPSVLFFEKPFFQKKLDIVSFVREAQNNVKFF
jgi:hypothetical protein